METNTRFSKLVASTGATYCCSIAESRKREALQLGSRAVTDEVECPAYIRHAGPDEFESNHFKSMQWTPDGTSLLSLSADNAVRTFILPPELLEERSEPLQILPYTTHHFPSSINCIVPYPHYRLSDPTTTLYLSTPTDFPIRLVNTLSQTSTPLASYPLVCPSTEAYLTPSSLLWSPPGTNFVTGSESLISLFDISNNGSGPVTSMPTIPSKRHKIKGGGVGMRGIVSALSLQTPDSGDGILAAGTWTRWIGLYDAEGMGGTVATWEVREAADDVAGIGGMGVSQMTWSADGRYLIAVERKSRGVLVYDVRVAGKLVCWLAGREAVTNQRLGVEVLEGDKGLEIWAGGTDGVVRTWEGVGQREGQLESSRSWKAHDDPVSSAVLHSTGTVLATCSGQRYVHDFEEDSSDSHEIHDLESGTTSILQPPGNSLDNSIKVWSL